MSQRLTDMALTRVSVVDKGANARRFAVLKRDEEEGGVADQNPQVTEDPPAGVLAWLRKQLGLEAAPEHVAKTATFAERVAGQELRDAFYDSWYTLEDGLWAAMYAYGPDGQELSLEAKKALVAQNLDEFKAYLMSRMDGGISKRDGGPAEAATRAVSAAVAKVGKKISGSRLERLTAAAEALNGVLAEVAEVVADEEADPAEEADVEKAELVAAMTEALEPVTKRLMALEKSAAPAAAGGADEGDEGDEGEKPATLDTVVAVVGKLADRIEAIEKARGERTSAAGQDGGEVKKSQFAGIF